jgi:hypothetical protein
MEQGAVGAMPLCLPIQCRGDRSLDSARDTELVEVLVAQRKARRRAGESCRAGLKPAQQERRAGSERRAKRKEQGSKIGEQDWHKR